MVVVSNEWLGEEAEKQSFLRSNGLRMSAQSLAQMNTSTITRSDWTPQSQSPLQQQQGVTQPQQQQQQQLQQQQSQPIITQEQWKSGSVPQNQNTQNNKNGQTAHAILICEPNSHPFQPRNISLEPGIEVKVGRAVARNRVGIDNAIFDCKVLSRNHAVISYSDGKFYIKDTGSSNGTFINRQRLSQTCVQSEPTEVNSRDIVQFGVDVMENARKETHGCIVATLKLYLPDGTEAQPAFASSRNIPEEDLLEIHQYIQEAIGREQLLESKLIDMQNFIEKTKKHSATSWQAMIDEDRLLSRIDILENKLQYFLKDISEDKIRNDIIKLQDDKLIYQNSAKEALRKVYQEKMDAIQTLTKAEHDMCNRIEDFQIVKDELEEAKKDTINYAVELTTLKKKYDELIETRSKEKNLEIENQDLSVQLQQQIIDCREAHEQLATLTKERNMLQEQINTFEEEFDEKISNMSKKQKKQQPSIIKWFENSELKNMTGSDDIISAICNDSETNGEDNSFQTTNYSHIYDKLLEIEKMICVIENESSDSTKSTTDTNSTNESNLNDNNVKREFNQDKIKDVIMQLKNVYNELMNYISEKESLKNDVLNLQSKLVAYEKLVVSLQTELKTRPTQEQYDERVKICEELQSDVFIKTNLEISTNSVEDIEHGHESINSESAINNNNNSNSIDNNNNNNNNNNNSNNNDNNNRTNNINNVMNNIDSFSKKDTSDVHVQTDIIDNPIDKQYYDKLSSRRETVTNEDNLCVQNVEISINNDLKILSNPNLQWEEELIAFKEKCSRLNDANLNLKKQINDLTIVKQTDCYTTLLMYIIPPLFAVIGYLLISPYFYNEN